MRIRDGQAGLTCKGVRIGITRDPFACPIPQAEVCVLMAPHCAGHVLSMARHALRFQGFLGEIDVYDARISGVFLAEIELRDATTGIPLPAWVGERGTDRANYLKINPPKTFQTLLV